MPQPKTSDVLEQVENQKALKITLEPPTLVHKKKQIPSTTLSVEAVNQNQLMKPETSECKTKPTQEKPPTETKPEPNCEKTQELKYMTKPEARTKTNAVTKPKPSQQRRIKPKLAETNDLKLFLAKKTLEREMKLKGKIIVDYSSTPSPSPSNDSVSATLSPCNISLIQSAPRADRLQSRDITELSPSLQQGVRSSSANKEGY